MDPFTGQTATIHRDSPRPTKLRDYETRADEIMDVVKRALYDPSTTREHARAQVDLLHFKGPGQDDDPPEKWHLLFGAANAIIDAASLAHSPEQRLRLANAGLPYLTKLLESVKREEDKRERDRGLFITEQEIRQEGGVDYLIGVFSDAVTHNQDVHFE